jgi:hypothetical protein
MAVRRLKGKAAPVQDRGEPSKQPGQVCVADVRTVARTPTQVRLPPKVRDELITSLHRIVGRDVSNVLLADLEPLISLRRYAGRDWARGRAYWKSKRPQLIRLRDALRDVTTAFKSLDNDVAEAVADSLAHIRGEERDRIEIRIESLPPTLTTTLHDATALLFALSRLTGGRPKRGRPPDVDRRLFTIDAGLCLWRHGVKVSRGSDSAFAKALAVIVEAAGFDRPVDMLDLLRVVHTAIEVERARFREPLFDAVDSANLDARPADLLRLVAEAETARLGPAELKAILIAAARDVRRAIEQIRGVAGGQMRATIKNYGATRPRTRP